MEFKKSPIDYFTEKPWACKCGCGYDEIDPMLVVALNAARHKAGVPFVINSACRCPDYNMVQGGAYTSDHLTGQGVDIATPTSQMRFRIIKALIKTGFTRIGVGGTFVHAGMRTDNPQKVIWVY